MNQCQKRFYELLNKVDFAYKNAIKRSNHSAAEVPKILVVTKNQTVESINPLINLGHRLFGENRVQEAMEKWVDKKDAILHLIGPLQTNKVKDALKLFDVIESLDREKLAIKIAKEQEMLGLSREFFIQVNIGNETQKSGVKHQMTEEFMQFCKNDLNLNVTGLMCIPPKEKDSLPYFQKMKIMVDKCNLQKLSMGMSSDYIEAIECGSTQIRIGSAIFNC